MNKKAILLLTALLLVTNFITFKFTSFLATEVNLPKITRSPAPYPISSPTTILKGESIDIREIPATLFHRYWRDQEILPHNTEYEVIYRDDENKARRVKYKGQRIDSLEYAPQSTIEKSESLLGFFYDTQPDNPGSDVALVIMNVDTGEIKEVYHGNFRTSNWEWDGSERVIVYYGCGTACLYAYKIDINTGKKIDGWHLITNYPPSPWPTIAPNN